MPDLRDRLAQLMADAWPQNIMSCWVDSLWVDSLEYERDYWRDVADALLASEEWQAREAVVEAAREQHITGVTRQHAAMPCVVCAALARLATVRGEETR